MTSFYKNLLSVVLFFGGTFVLAQEPAKKPQELDSVYGYLWNSDTQTWEHESKSFYENGYNRYIRTAYRKDPTTGEFLLHRKEIVSWEKLTNGDLNKLIEEFVYDETTVAFIPQNKKIINTNSDDKKLLFEEYNWDLTTQTWTGVQKYETLYSSSGKMVYDAYFDWDPGRNDWKGVYRHDFTYDINDNETHYTEYIWDGTNHTWQNSYLFSSYYTAEGLLDYKTTESWDVNTTSWLMYSKTVYSHTLTGKLSGETGLYINPQTSTWDTGSETTYFYNLEDDLTEKITIYKSGNKSKMTYIYDAMKNVIESISYNSWTEGVWNPVSKYENGYDTNNNHIYSYTSDWNPTTAIWETRYKELKEYDSNNLLIMFEYHQIDLTTKQLTGTDKVILTYNNYGNVTVFYSYKWESTLSEWVNFYKGESFHSLIITSAYQKQASLISTYPNPFTNFLQVEPKDPGSTMLFELYDLNGKRVLTETIHPETGKQINTGNLENGLYMYRAISNGNIETGKVLKN